MRGSITNAPTMKLPYLESINFSNNSLSGTLTWNWSIFGLILDYFPSLENLELTENKLIGSFPSDINAATSLEVIDVSFNSMSGTFPELISLQNLRHLDIRENEFSGKFPDIYFSSTTFLQLRYVGLSHNLDLEVPNVCIRIPFCYKSDLLIICRRSINETRARRFT